MSAITARTVIRALGDLDFDQRGRRVTTERVVAFLEAPAEEVEPLLKTLEQERIIRRRGQFWQPWGGQR